MASILDRTAIVQNAYVVNDLREACRRYNSIYGVGPFLLVENIPLMKVTYRGEEVEHKMSAAFCQSGDMNIEFIQQHHSGPSCYRDMFAEGEEGFHHVAVFCKDYEAEKAKFEAAGYPVANEFQTGEDTFLCYVDTRPALGHMIELYMDHPGTRGLYAAVKAMGENWDGKELFTTLGQP